MLSFLDTNILLYSCSPAPTQLRKRQRAQELLEGSDLALSVQVLQEFYWQATRAARPHPLTHDTAVGLIGVWRRYPVLDISQQVLDSALEICQDHRIPYWDSAIIAAAGLSGCEVLLTEDMQNGATIAGVTIHNPFV